MTDSLSVKEIKNTVSEYIKKEYEDFGADHCNRLVKIVNDYGKRDSFLGVIDGIFYQTWNSVKTIFEESDWELARKSFAKIKMVEVEENLLNSLFHLHINPKHLSPLCDYKLEISRGLAEVNLQVFVDTTHQNTFKSHEEIKEYIVTQYQQRLSTGEAFGFILCKKNPYYLPA